MAPNTERSAGKKGGEESVSPAKTPMGEPECQAAQTDNGSAVEFEDLHARTQHQKGPETELGGEGNTRTQREQNQRTPTQVIKPQCVQNTERTRHHGRME